jgi:hypothetical protein
LRGKAGAEKVADVVKVASGGGRKPVAAVPMLAEKAALPVARGARAATGLPGRHGVRREKVASGGGRAPVAVALRLVEKVALPVARGARAATVLLGRHGVRGV